MRSIRVTRKDGYAWTVPLDLERLNVGRDPTNEIVLEDEAVSRWHCLLECQGDLIQVKDRGTANGTFVNNEFLSEPRRLAEGDRVYVGSFLLELVSLADVSIAPRSSPSRPAGPILRKESGTADDRNSARLLKWAQHWQSEGRPRDGLLRGRLLAEAREHVRAGPTDPLVVKFVARSTRRHVAVRIIVVLVVLVIVPSIALATIIFLRWHDKDPTLAQASDSKGESASEESTIESKPKLAIPKPPPPNAPAATWVEHKVIPSESLDDIARRYGVSIANVARWNGLNPDAPALDPGQLVRVNAVETPLPQQLVQFDLDRNYDWKSLGDRFDVDVAKLRAYNPGLEELLEGARIEVWINPKPYGKRTELLDLPTFEIRPDALSVGAPNRGKLKDAIKMPKSPLYIRRAPNIMWGSSHTIETLLKAIARFRQDLAFDHELVLADISKRNGGKFKPHKSHQAGRDIDIWMPTLKGVYKEKYLGNETKKERKPRPNEIDWYATWGLVRALLDTGEIVHIFLDYSLQENLYKAAREMGESVEDLRPQIQYPRGKGAAAKLAHSAGHIGHIHVRFRCAKTDIECRHDIVRGEPDDQ